MRRASYVLAWARVGAIRLPCSPVATQPYSQADSRRVGVGIFYDRLAALGLNRTKSETLGHHQ